MPDPIPVPAPAPAAPAVTPKPPVALPSFKLAKDAAVTVKIAVQVVAGRPIPRVALTKSEVASGEFALFTASFRRPNWGLLNHLRASSFDVDPTTGARTWNAARNSELRWRHLLLTWNIPGDAGQPIAVKRRAHSGYEVLTDECWAEVNSVEPAVLESFLMQLSRFLDQGESEQDLNNPVIEGVEMEPLDGYLRRALALRGFAQDKVDACLRVLADGPLTGELALPN